MKRLYSILVLFLLCLSMHAEDRETALWSFISLSKPLNQRWSVSAQTELRTGSDNTRLYLFYIDGNARYKINNWLAANVGFDYIKVHSRPTSSRPSLWRTDWRPYVSIIPSWKMGPIRASLNESLTYNWFPETSVNGIQVNGKSYYLVRHRLTLEYPITDSRFFPYVKCEIRQTKKLERVRATLGTTIKLSPHTSLDAAYVYQDMHNSMKTQALSVGYRIKL